MSLSMTLSKTLLNRIASALIISTIFCAAFVAPSFATGPTTSYIPVTGIYIEDQAGNLLANGTFCMQATNAAAAPMPIHISSATVPSGNAVSHPVCAPVTAGVIASGFRIANPSQTWPVNALYTVTITDTDSNSSWVYPRLQCASEHFGN